MSSQETPTIAFILSLVGGILITVGGLSSSALFPFGMYGFGGMMGGFWRGMEGMMGGFWRGFGGMMGGYGMTGGYWGYPQAVTSTVFSFGFVLVAGIITIVGSIMLNSRPAEHITWGAIILIFSIISLAWVGSSLAGFWE
jgi:hypothetical protein